MLTIYGKGQPYCDRISRRSFLRIGAFTLGSAACLTLADLVRAEQVTGKRNRHKAVIHVFLAGGPPHQDLWDMKMDAPSEIRGEMKPISTNVPGIEICEVFPRMAKMMDRFAVVRSIVGSDGDHDGYQCLSGWSRRARGSAGGYPAIGPVVWKLKGSTDRSMPAAIGLSGPTREVRWSEAGSPGYLGPAYAPFRPNAVVGEGKGEGADEIRLKGITLERLQDRRRLLQSLDAYRRTLDASLEVQAHQSATEAAFDLLTSSKLADALDLSKESEKTRERYGTGKPFKFQYDGAPTVNEHLLVARRLVEAGCRCVSVSYGRWDSHGDNFGLVRDHGPKLDQCLTALVEDLEQRGMLDDVLVIAWGEFGRTPQINKDAGRDHWPAVNGALIAGGGMKVGQVIGSTDRIGAYVDERPIHLQEVLATIYHHMGVDVESTLLEDRAGRPQYLLDHRQPVRELIG
jgi:uncharacterized protein (DUF1501 family)